MSRVMEMTTKAVGSTYIAKAPAFKFGSVPANRVLLIFTLLEPELQALISATGVDGKDLTLTTMG